MKKYFIIALSLCAVMSCSKENTITNNTPLSFTAGFDEGTKSMLNDDRSQSWLGGDKVIVYDITDIPVFADLVSASFTNISTSPSSSAIFTLDAESSSFTFENNHKYLALHNARVSATQLEKIKSCTIKFTNTISFDSSRKYGMPDNTIPVASFFTYTGESSLQNISFHNITALCVVRVKNKTMNPIHISRISLSETYGGTAWKGRVFGGCIYYSNRFGNYKLQGVSSGSDTSTISCDKIIDSGAECDFSTIMAIPYSREDAGGITLTVKVMDGSDCLAQTQKIIQDASGPATWTVGDTKVFNIEINPN